MSTSHADTTISTNPPAHWRLQKSSSSLSSSPSAAAAAEAAAAVLPSSAAAASSHKSHEPQVKASIRYQRSKQCAFGHVKDVTSRHQKWIKTAQTAGKVAQGTTHAQRMDKRRFFIEVTCSPCAPRESTLTTLGSDLRWKGRLLHAFMCSSGIFQQPLVEKQPSIPIKTHRRKCRFPRHSRSTCHTKVRFPWTGYSCSNKQ